MKRRVLFVLCLALASACGGDDAEDPAEACERLVEITCDKLYSCLTEAEREFLNLPATEGACIAQFSDQAGCAEQTVDNICQGNEVYQPDAAAKCLDQAAALECSQARDGVEGDLPACDDFCQVE